jgi:catalase
LGQSKGGKIVVKENNMLTTALGIPWAYDQNNMTAGERGLILLQDVHLWESPVFRAPLRITSENDRRKLNA